jgi:hypothetical protein
MGSTILANNGHINVHIISTPEFGKIKKLVIKKGILGQNSETDCFAIINPEKYELDNKYEVYADSNCYYRCEVELELGGPLKRFALTNPIWFEIIS